MPLKVIPPRSGKSRTIQSGGHTSESLWTEAQELLRRPLQSDSSRKLELAIERGEYPEKPKEPNAPTFLSAAVAYMKAGRPRRYIGRLIEYFSDTPLPEIDQTRSTRPQRSSIRT